MELEDIAGTSAVAPWLRTAMPSRAWAAPLDLIGRGDAEAVADLITALGDASR